MERDPLASVEERIKSTTAKSRGFREITNPIITSPFADFKSSEDLANCGQSEEKTGQTKDYAAEQIANSAVASFASSITANASVAEEQTQIPRLPESKVKLNKHIGNQMFVTLPRVTGGSPPASPAEAMFGRAPGEESEGAAPCKRREEQ